MTKFLLEGPIPFLSKEYPLAGMISPSFFMMVLLNTMFGIRILCIENIVFTSYIYVDNSNWNINKNTFSESILPLLSGKHRILFYFLPGLLPFIINIIRLAWTTREKISYFIKYPQFILSPCFSPIMFEGIDGPNKNSGVRIWKLGSILNAFFIGCIPQILLICLEFYKGTPNWKFIGGKFKEKTLAFENNDALVKHPYGNIIFGGASLIVNFILIITFFCTDSLEFDPELEERSVMKIDTCKEKNKSVAPESTIENTIGSKTSSSMPSDPKTGNPKKPRLEEPLEKEEKPLETEPLKALKTLEKTKHDDEEQIKEQVKL